MTLRALKVKNKEMKIKLLYKLMTPFYNQPKIFMEKI